MFILSYTKPINRRLPQAHKLARDLGAVVEGNVVVIKIPSKELFKAYEKLSPLLGYIQRLKSTRATYKGKEIDPFKFIFKYYRIIAECQDNKMPNLFEDYKYCWEDPTHQGWGCKHLTSIKRHLCGQIKKKQPLWFQYGEFDMHGDWVVHRDKIFQLLWKEVEKKGLDSCPHFFESTLRHIVFKDLPHKIHPDGAKFKRVFEEDFRDGRLQMVPVGITHTWQGTEEAKDITQKIRREVIIKGTKWDTEQGQN